MSTLPNTPERTIRNTDRDGTSLLVRAARFLNRSFPQSYAAFSLLPRLTKAYLWLYRLEKANVGQRLSRLPIQEHKSSDTVFVFGTGASINSYPDRYWGIVRRHDSIGMNFFLLHEHVPTFHIMEGVNDIRRDLLTARYVERADYRNTPLIMKTQLTNLSATRVGARIDQLRDMHPDVLANAYLSVDLLAAGRSLDDMEAAYRLTYRLGLWKPRPRFLTLTKRRGSVAYIVNLAVRSGYRRIVLCGIDLNHTEYFYDSRREELEAMGLPVPPNPEEGTVHSTNDPANHPVTIHDVLMTIKKQILDPAGIELFVGSKTSALHPDLPCFDWQAEVAALS